MNIANCHFNFDGQTLIIQIRRTFRLKLEFATKTFSKSFYFLYFPPRRFSVFRPERFSPLIEMPRIVDLSNFQKLSPTLFRSVFSAMKAQNCKHRGGELLNNFCLDQGPGRKREAASTFLMTKVNIFVSFRVPFTHP